MGWIVELFAVRSQKASYNIGGTHQTTDRMTYQGTNRVTHKETDRVTQETGRVTYQGTKWVKHQVTEWVAHQGAGRQVPWQVRQIREAATQPLVNSKAQTIRNSSDGW